MSATKPFLSIDDQVELLKRRGLVFSNIEKSKRYLLENNYYTIINGYSKFFKGPDDKYITGASFDEIRSVQLFDKEIKTAFFKSLMDIEKHLKSIISYIFSSYHPESYSYLLASNFKNKNIIECTSMISQLSKVIKYKVDYNNKNSISHYYYKYNDIPFWILVDYLTFGQLVTFFTFMNDKEKNEVARQLTVFINENLGVKNNPFKFNDLISFLKNINELRNIIAHNNRILEFKCKANTSFDSDIHVKFDINKSASRQDIYNVFIVMQCFLTRNQYATLYNTLLKRFKVLEGSIKSIDFNYITMSLGFPKNWSANRKLPQNL